MRRKSLKYMDVNGRRAGYRHLANVFKHWPPDHLINIFFIKDSSEGISYLTWTTLERIIQNKIYVVDIISFEGFIDSENYGVEHAKKEIKKLKHIIKNAFQS